MTHPLPCALAAISLLAAILPATAAPPLPEGPGGRTVSHAAWEPTTGRWAVVAWEHPAGPDAVESARTLDELAAAVDADVWVSAPADQPDATTSWTRVADSPATDYAPVWSPDGAQLLYLSTRGGRAALYLVELDGGGTWQLGGRGDDPDPAPLPVTGRAAWIGDELVYTAADGSELRRSIPALRAAAQRVEPPAAERSAPRLPEGVRGPSRGPLYETVDPGPFDLPADWLDVQGDVVLFDLDPAEGAMEDYTGWYGSEEQPDHARDGHAGTDFAMPTGTEVLAPARGVVVEIVDGVPVDEPDAANFVVLAHGTPGEWRSTYWHLSPGIDEYVEVGQEVERGDVIALSDHTGDSWAPHLHFGVFHWGEAGCPFHEGWWWKGLTFFQGVVQYADAPVLDATDGGGAEVGQQAAGATYCGTQTVKSGHYRYWRPLDWGTVVQALDHEHVLAHPDDYAETGAWSSAERGAVAEHVVGDSGRLTQDPSATATFVPRIGTEGEYEVRVAFGRLANARDVRYTVTHRDGSDEVVLDQNGGGAGTEEAPRVVTASPYGDTDDVTRSSSYVLAQYDCEDAPEQEGAEVIYHLEIAEAGSISAIVVADEGVEVDVFILDELEGNGCLAWGDMIAGVVGVPAGGYFVVVDTRTEGDVAPAPGPYQLSVTYGAAPAGDSAKEAGVADRWISLGTFPFAAGKDPAQGAVEVALDGDLVPMVDGPSRFAADAVWFHNPQRDFYAYGEGAEGSEIAEDVLILKEYALLGITSAASWPVYAAPSADAPLRFRARRGQRFLSSTNLEGWYEIRAPELGDELGYLHEDGCFVYNRLAEDPIVQDDDDDSAAPPTGDDGGCECAAAPGSTPATALAPLALLTAWAWRRRRRPPPPRG